MVHDEREGRVEEETPKKNLFAKIGLSLFALSICGAVLVLPYVAALEANALAAAAARAHVDVWQALAVSVAQSVVLLGVAVLAVSGRRASSIFARRCSPRFSLPRACRKERRGRCSWPLPWAF